jgi:hypothetical protein
MQAPAGRRGGLYSGSNRIRVQGGGPREPSGGGPDVPEMYVAGMNKCKVVVQEGPRGPGHG